MILFAVPIRVESGICSKILILALTDGTCCITVSDGMYYVFEAYIYIYLNTNTYISLAVYQYVYINI